MHARIDRRGQLPENGFRIGKESQVLMMVKGGRCGRVRLKQGEALQIELHFKEKPTAPAARLYSNLSASGEFCEVDMRAAGPGVFQIQCPTEKAGTFFFTLQYTMDGQQWYWLRGELWQLLVFPRPLQSLRLYTLIPTASGPMHQWKTVLQRAAELGFNMVHLLPVTKQGGSQSPYAAADLFTLEPDFLPEGTDPSSMEIFEEFVEEAQRLGLGLCLDLVLNHVAIDSELAQRCPHWIYPDATEPDGLKRNGFHGHDGFHKWDDLALINYQHPDPRVRRAIWEHMEGYALFWGYYAAATGGMIRLDNLHSTDPAFAMHITHKLRREYPDLGILAELFTHPEATQKILQHYAVDLLLATTWEHHFSGELRRYFRYIHETTPVIPWFTPINSHDSGVPAEEFANVQATRPRYILCALLGIGATGLTQGVEVGIEEKINFIGRQPVVPPSATQHDFWPLIQRTHELMTHYSVFQQQGNVEFLDHGHVAIIAAARLSRTPGEPHALVIANLDIHQAQSILLDLQPIGLGQSSLTDAFSMHAWTLEGHTLHCTLEPCGFQVILIEKK
ncbi:alpha-amylase family glycosyl hydrolase [Oligoflexus tunisiensis]|uniref:alpha-amylase family glycosyl hydrolase n=1 Tax=Oligoflexus tunisiensis TaxID=708132 RepID=UPI00159F2955|nr:alpha-amylase family glycosyl hydrolase [Oligoflexus tunisiensis]